MLATSVPESTQRIAIERWKKLGRPPAEIFAPYTAFVAKVEALFILSVAHCVVTTRATNRIDIEYLKYLPFTFAFSSADKLHIDLWPYFARKDQVFLGREELRASLAEMISFYDNLSDEEKKHGSATYAQFPPVHLDNAITKAFDKALPDWRRDANKPRPPISPAENAAIMARLKPMMDAIEADEQRRRRRES